ncbi:hypothetical protein B0T16DRAFT_249459 [Cercophora newfieldiana]|uniref:Uncharacterized protein n=1 Tax=Cercophora newfieldiana TaxID=92897 RepID=A0AA39XVN6_9PEZI|nr:hypothetical protein B0T16DRAFT_249459 [Cercophora newfieldiana]
MQIIQINIPHYILHSRQPRPSPLMSAPAAARTSPSLRRISPLVFPFGAVSNLLRGRGRRAFSLPASTTRILRTRPLAALVFPARRRARVMLFLLVFVRHAGFQR